MKSIKYLGLGLIATTVLGMAAPAAFASEVTNQTKSNDTTVIINDNQEPAKLDLQLLHVPTNYKFSTDLQAGEYTITATAPDGASDDSSTEQGQTKFEVFTNKRDQKWSVKSTVAATLTDTVKSKTVEVTGFKLNGKDIKAGEVVMSGGDTSKDTNVVVDESGHATKDVNSLEIKIKAIGAGKIEAGDKYIGKVNNVLYDTADAQ